MEGVPSPSFSSSSSCSSFIRCIAIFTIFITLLQLPTTRSATQEDYFCTKDEDSFLPGSAYEANLHILLNYLVINTKVTSSRNDIVYAVGALPDRVYGEAICLSYDTTDCSICLYKAKSDLLLVCDNKKGGQVSDVDDCYLSYNSIDMYNMNDSTIIAAATTTSSLPVQLHPPPLTSVEIGTPPSPPKALDQQVLLPPPPPPRKEGKKLALLITLPVVAALMVSSFLLFFLLRRRRTKNQEQEHSGKFDYHNSSASRNLQEISADLEIGCIEACPFQLQTLAKATNNFSSENLLGEGGCRPVYKGILDDGQAIAVKKVTVESKEGREQLENEIVLVSKLQHRNLAKILGFCFEEDDPLLVYEYLPNTSLDKILHDPKKSKQLDWATRYKIINGVSQGLLYIHEYSVAKIVHRNLKTSNVILDTDMNPRISDFGIARYSERDQTNEEADQVSRTLAYMAPEYYLYGEYSMKSDVYSFGVLILEIITGMRKPSSSNSKELIDDVSRNLLEGTITEVLDPAILRRSYVEEEVLRCINAALLCVRDDPSDRPEMSLLVVMLANPMGITTQ